MDNVQKHNICTNVPSSQTYTSYKPKSIGHFCGEFQDSEEFDCVCINILRFDFLNLHLLSEVTHSTGL
jgi:hypothetical protein